MSTDSNLALLGGSPVRGPEKSWPQWPIHDQAEEEAVLDVLRSGKWFFGERVARFEREFAAFQDAAHGISCTSGTTALEVVFQALGIGPGDEVVVPPYTFIATASAVMRVGATPVFADIDASWCMDPVAAEAAITPRTKALVPVHFGGRICDIDRYRALAAKHGVTLVEDACHSWGAKWEGKGSGALGACGVFSFQQSKNITAGEGGIILTNDPALAGRCRSIVNCGREEGGVWYHHVNAGTNARLTEFQAAILSVQLGRLEEQTLLRERNAAILNDRLGGIEGLIVQPASNRITRRAYHLYCLRIDAASFGCSRAKFAEAISAEGVPISPGYPIPLYEQPAIARFYAARQMTTPRCPVAEEVCRESGLWFLHQMLLGSAEDMEDIAAAIEKVKAHAASLAS